jgi:hypothetical protein
MTPTWNGTDLANFNDYWLYLVGRLKPGSTREQAAAALNGPYSALVEEQAKTARFRDPSRVQRFRESRLSVVDGSHGKSSVRDQGKTPILILQIATAFVLLIAMANAANLLLARSAERNANWPSRGHGRGARKLMTQLLVEAMLLALPGAPRPRPGTVTLKFRSLRVARPAAKGFSPRRSKGPLFFAPGLGLFTGLLFGLYPMGRRACGLMARCNRNPGIRRYARFIRVDWCARRSFPRCC